ncbi:chondroitinase-B domain-containing protein [Flavobacterium sp. GSA192]|uniref:chondroitinase-B domain-containing protein n=1 Tax=Flavobacterium sp. GSA192 TaxID=2576304 RepID=UPI00112BECE5|nr:chondroitinase-B domain-containing protein [Flavobacterium sp. GSA192]
MRIKCFLSFVVLIGINTNIFAKKIYVDNVAQTYKVLNNLRPGDSLVFKKGEYKDIQLLLKQNESSSKPIVLIAETPGSVIFCGDVKVAMYGTYTELNGIYFTNGNRNPNQWKSHGPGLIAMYASYCRVSNCAFNNFDEANSAYITTSLDENGNVPTHCRIDHCSFTNKLTFDQVINLNNQKAPDKTSQVIAPPMYHRVDHCFFSNPKKKGNAGGAIRVGYYRNALGRCLVDSNLFIRQDSESEIVTSKSMENVYYANTVLNCQGTLNFRHGDKQVAINNFFLSDDEKYKGYGGMYIWGSKHIIAGNYFSLSKTIESRGNAAIYLNTGAEGTEHALAFGSIIAKNMFVNNNGYAIHFNPLEELRKNFSKEKNLPYNVPHHITLSDNTFFDNKKYGYTFFKDDYKDLNRNNQWNKNIYWGKQTGLTPLLGLEEKQFEMVLQNGFYFLKNKNAQSSLAGLPNFYNNIEGIELNFDEAVSNSTMQKPLSIEQVIPKWMLNTLGDYYKTGKLSPELEVRLKRISATREE